MSTPVLAQWSFHVPFLPFHYVIYDRFNKSVVMEWAGENGTFTAYENPVRQLVAGLRAGAQQRALCCSSWSLASSKACAALAAAPERTRNCPNGVRAASLACCRQS